MYASLKNSKEVAKLLIENKADVNAKTENGFTALMYASLKNSKEVAKLLIENGAKIKSKPSISESFLVTESLSILSHLISSFIGDLKKGRIIIQFPLFILRTLLFPLIFFIRLYLHYRGDDIAQIKYMMDRIYFPLVEEIAFL
jgi:hypothetical protein